MSCDPTAVARCSPGTISCDGPHTFHRDSIRESTLLDVQASDRGYDRLVRAVALTLVLAGCDIVLGLDRPPAGTDAVASDGAPTDGQPSYACSFVGGEQPLPGFNNDVANPTQRGDKLELYYARWGGSDYDLYVATRSKVGDDYAGMMEDVALSSGNNDTNPALTQGGLRIFFKSTRGGVPAPLFEATRTAVDQPFSTPTRVGTGGSNPQGLDVSPDGRTLYFDEGGELFEMLRAGDTGDFGAKKTIGSGGIASPSVAGDELTVYYDNAGNIYRQTRTTEAETFSGPVVITAGTHPDISEDGHTLIFQNASGFAMLECR